MRCRVADPQPGRSEPQLELHHLPRRDQLGAEQPADGGGGGARITGLLPTGLPVKQLLYMQAWIVDPGAGPGSLAVTNGLAGTLQ